MLHNFQQVSDALGKPLHNFQQISDEIGEAVHNFQQVSDALERKPVKSSNLLDEVIRRAREGK
jgi:ABC-type transporter Mla subunit MlaD